MQGLPNHVERRRLNAGSTSWRSIKLLIFAHKWNWDAANYFKSISNLNAPGLRPVTSAQSDQCLRLLQTDVWSFFICRTKNPVQTVCLHSQTLWKHAYSNILKILQSKKKKKSDKKNWYFYISAQNIDCGYSLEPPRRGGSNEYPQSMFWGKNKKNNVYPCKPQFYYIKVGFKRLKIIQVCFRDVWLLHEQPNFNGSNIFGTMEIFRDMVVRATEG